MKKFLVVVSLLMLSACSNSYDTLDFPVVPKELSDCKFYTLTNDIGARLKVVVCPHADTTSTYTSGKTTQSTFSTWE